QNVHGGRAERQALELTRSTAAVRRRDVNGGGRVARGRGSHALLNRRHWAGRGRTDARRRDAEASGKDAGHARDPLRVAEGTDAAWTGSEGRGCDRGVRARSAVRAVSAVRPIRPVLPVRPGETLGPAPGLPLLGGPGHLVELP